MICILLQTEGIMTLVTSKQKTEHKFSVCVERLAYSIARRLKRSVTGAPSLRILLTRPKGKGTKVRDGCSFRIETHLRVFLKELSYTSTQPLFRETFYPSFSTIDYSVRSKISSNRQKHHKGSRIYDNFFSLPVLSFLCHLFLSL